jgi:hypothetical protein
MRRSILKAGLLVVTLLPMIGACSSASVLPTAPEATMDEQAPSRSLIGSQG